MEIFNGKNKNEKNEKNEKTLTKTHAFINHYLLKIMEKLMQSLHSKMPW